MVNTTKIRTKIHHVDREIFDIQREKITARGNFNKLEKLERNKAARLAKLLKKLPPGTPVKLRRNLD